MTDENKKRKLAGKTAVVTGAGRGIGRSIALSFAKAGANLAICSRTLKELEEVKGEAEALGVQCIIGQVDLTNPDDTACFCKATLNEFGSVDLLVNNAGAEFDLGKVEDSDPNLWWKTLEVNVRGPYLVTRYLLEGFNEGSKIINVSSGLGLRASDWNSSYHVSKAGMHMFTECLANELWPRKIDVNNLIPGPVATAIFDREDQSKRSTPEEVLERFADELPPGFPEFERLKHPDEVGDLALYIATQPVGGPTGQTFSLARRPLG